MNDIQQKVHAVYSGLQSRLGNNDACHFLVLCSIIHECRGREVDILGLASHSIIEGWLREDYYVKDALAILRYATKSKWIIKVLKQSPDDIGPSSFTELKWYNPRTGYTHFTRRYVDTLVNSVTVAEGRVEEYRIYTKL